MTVSAVTSTDEDAYPVIEDLAAIGNGHTVALISRAGTVEWWCPMRFDHPSIFASVLDRANGDGLTTVSGAAVEAPY